MDIRETAKAATLPPPSRGVFAALFPELCGRKEGRGAEILHDALVFGVAMLLSRAHLAAGAYPFAFAYLAARRQRCVPCLLGAILGAVSLGAVAGIYITAYLGLFFLRVLVSLPVPRRALFPVTEALFSEGRGVRVMVAALVGAGLAGYELLFFGVTTYALFFSAASVLAPTVLTLLYGAVYDAPFTHTSVLGRARPTLGRTTPLTELAALSLLVSLAYALLPLSLFGLSFFSLFAVGVTLFVARRLGAPRAGVVGLSLGLIGSLTAAPAYALLGVLAGLLFPYGTLPALLVGTLGAVGFSAYAGGLSGFLSFAPECCVVVLIGAPVLGRLLPSRDPDTAELSLRRRREAAEEGARRREGEGDRLSRLGTALSSLSGMFYRLSDETRRPAAAEYFVECEKVCARHCATCSNRVRCWEQGERVAEKSVYALAGTLRKTGKISRDTLPPELRSGCPKIETILDEIREECASLCLRRHRGDRNEFLSHDYAMLSRVLTEAAEGDRREAAPDPDTAARLAALLERELPEISVAVYGARGKRVAAACEDGALLERGAPLLHAAAEELLGCRFTEPELAVGDGVATLTMRSRRRFAVETAAAGVPRTAGETSGDRLRFFETAEDSFYALLSDGMGSGEAAGRAASVSVEFLSGMLEAGCGRATALRMLNNLVRTREDECSATVDMLAFDLVYGSATFVKSGAAPSYIKRGPEVFRVRSRTMPLGLMKTPDAERINVEVREGDILVMLSDGIAPENEDPAWLIALLAEEEGADLEALATRIVAEAVSRNERDDTTVGIVKISLAG